MLDLNYANKTKFFQMFGVYVSELRAEMGLSVQEFQRRTKISPSRLLKIEQGQAELREKTIDLIAATLNMSEKRLTQITEVARVDYIKELMGLMWEPGPEESDARQA